MDATATLQFPAVKDTDVAFPSAIPQYREWLTKAKEANPSDKYRDLFGQLFYKGGAVPHKAGVSHEERTAGIRYLKVVMGSYSPRHEDKEVLAAYILSLIA